MRFPAGPRYGWPHDAWMPFMWMKDREGERDEERERTVKELSGQYRLSSYNIKK